jgi:hypothetical protein
LLAVAVTAAATVLSPAVRAQSSFHITFGTTGTPGNYYADHAGFLAETDGGDIVVAGTGASYASDTGRARTYPLIARVDPDGTLKWQRVYRNVENRNIAGLLAVGEEQFVLLRAHPMLSLPDDPPPEISLHRVSPSGDLSPSVGALGGFRTLEPFPVMDQDPHFIVLAARMVAAPSPSLEAKLFRLDLRGRVTELASQAGIDSLENLTYAGEEQLLVSQTHSTSDGVRVVIRTDVTRLSSRGATEVVLTIADRMCRTLAASMTRYFCSEHEWPGTETSADTLVAYSSTGGVLWRHDLAPGTNVGLMRPVEPGGLVYSYLEGRDTMVARLSAAGELLWTRNLRSTGTHVFLAGIQALRGGRVAFLGSTGAFGVFESTDTDAMLVVADIADGDLSSAIVSTVVDWSDTSQ